MALFIAQVESVQRFVDRQKRLGTVRILTSNRDRPWPAESTLVLEEEMGLELGNPRDGSLHCLLVAPRPFSGADGVLLIGPEIGELGGRSAPLAQIITVAGDFADEYAGYRELRDIVYDTKLRGLMTRMMPSRGAVWLRISRQALQRKFSLADLGAALHANLKAAPGVEAAQILFVTSGREDLVALDEPCLEARRIIAAMVKMSEEMDFDCASCEYSDVCETVIDLRNFRRKLQEQRR